LDNILTHTAFSLVGSLTLVGFACYICRGRPATLGFSGRQARERETLREIEYRLLAEAKAAGSDHLR